MAETEAVASVSPKPPNQLQTALLMMLLWNVVAGGGGGGGVTTVVVVAVARFRRFGAAAAGERDGARRKEASPAQLAVVAGAACAAAAEAQQWLLLLELYGLRRWCRNFLLKRPVASGAEKRQIFSAVRLFEGAGTVGDRKIRMARPHACSWPLPLPPICSSRWSPRRRTMFPHHRRWTGRQRLPQMVCRTCHCVFGHDQNLCAPTHKHTQGYFPENGLCSSLVAVLLFVVVCPVLRLIKILVKNSTRKGRGWAIA